MIQGKWFAQGTDLSPVLELRESIFGCGTDTLDAESWSVAVYEDDRPVACGRIRWEEGAFILDNIGVLSDFRGRRLGDLILRLLLFKAQTHGARMVRLTCPADITGFFARLGFREGSAVSDRTDMFLPGDEIDLDTCASCKKQNCPNRH